VPGTQRSLKWQVNKAGTFRAKSLWSPGVPQAGSNSSDISKGRFARDICEFESCQPSHAVVSCRYGPCLRTSITGAERKLHPGLAATGSSSSEAGVLFLRP